MNAAELNEGIHFLAERGLNLFAVFAWAELPADVVAMMTTTESSPPPFSRLVLLGNGGAHFWPALQKHGFETEHPVDHYSQVVAQQFIDDYLAPASGQILYPGPYPVPLQRLGTLAGWSHPSPLGLGINSEYGVWFAYRVAFLTDAPLPPTPIIPTASPCDTCEEKPCITACPSGAVRGIGAFDIPTCADFRLGTNSICADRCLSRLACPHAPEHRYPLEQVQYHYNRSLSSIRLYQTSA